MSAPVVIPALLFDLLFGLGVRHIDCTPPGTKARSSISGAKLIAPYLAGVGLDTINADGQFCHFLSYRVLLYLIWCYLISFDVVLHQSTSSYVVALHLL